MFDEIMFNCIRWADPDCTAMPGQPATEVEQAPNLRQFPKISLIYWPRMRGVSDIKLIRTEETLFRKMFYKVRKDVVYI
mgnify:CR=1 FL=1